ncbi:hypothetical protein CO731_00282 [Aminobacter sp. MSH1]|nr:hypothetical protein CO731_00282 [Aminobacter sp. MSH1]
MAQGDNLAEERQLDHKAITIKELCTLYLNDLNAGLVLGQGGRPKKPTTIGTDTGRTRTTFATGSVTLPQLAERVYALISGLRKFGLFN